MTATLDDVVTVLQSINELLKVQLREGGYTEFEVNEDLIQ